MNIFVNISHPAHVHFFKNAITILCQRGHNIIVGTRNKEFTTELLKAYNIRHVALTTKGKGLTGLVRELAEQQLKIAKILRKNSVDICKVQYFVLHFSKRISHYSTLSGILRSLRQVRDSV